MTTTGLFSAAPLLNSLLHGAALGRLAAAVVLSRARLRAWEVPEPWAITAAWSLLGAIVAVAALVIQVVT